MQEPQEMLEEDEDEGEEEKGAEEDEEGTANQGSLSSFCAPLMAAARATRSSSIARSTQGLCASSRDRRLAVKHHSPAP